VISCCVVYFLSDLRYILFKYSTIDDVDPYTMRSCPWVLRTNSRHVCRTGPVDVVDGGERLLKLQRTLNHVEKGKSSGSRFVCAASDMRPRQRKYWSRIGNVVQQRDLLLPNNPALILIIQSTCFLGPALQCNLAVNLLGSVEVFQI
jgi:hypothetical protein